MSDAAIEAYRARRRGRLDSREWKESDHLRGSDGKFVSTGGSDTPEKIQKILDKSYVDRVGKIDAIKKELGRMRIGTTFHIKDDRGVIHRYEKISKGDNGWKVRIKTNDGWSPEQPINRGMIGAMFVKKGEK